MRMGDIELNILRSLSISKLEALIRLPKLEQQLVSQLLEKFVGG
jgi:hypothetical protein